MRRITERAFLCLLIVSLAGCAFWRSSEDRALRKHYTSNEYPLNPIPGLKKVGVCVIDATIKYHPDTDALTSALHSQLQSVEGLEVLPDIAVAAAVMREQIALPRDGLKLADALHADGVFVAVVTDYDPYDEPVLSMALMLFSRATSPAAALDLDKLVQGGRPVDLPDTPASRPVTAVFAVYDASQKTTRDRLQLYAGGQTAENVGLGWERYYRSMPNFMRFASYEIVWKLFDQLEVQKATDAGRRKAGG